MSAITENPILEIENFLQNFLYFVHSVNMEIKYPPKEIEISQNQFNLLVHKKSKRYLPKSDAQSEQFDFVMNALKGFLLNADTRQIEAFKKIVTPRINGIENEISELQTLLTEKEFSDTWNFIVIELSDFQYFKTRYDKYFGDNTPSQKRNNPKTFGDWLRVTIS